MKDLRIDRAEVFVVGPETERYTWAEGMTGQYMANIILKLTTAGGLEGIAGAAMITPHSFDRSVGETLRWLLPDVMGASAGEDVSLPALPPKEREVLAHDANRYRLSRVQLPRHIDRMPEAAEVPACECLGPGVNEVDRFRARSCHCEGPRIYAGSPG